MFFILFTGYTLIVKLQRNSLPSKVPNGYPDVLKESSNPHNLTINDDLSNSVITLNSSFNFGPLNEFLLSKFPNAKMT